MFCLQHLKDKGIDENTLVLFSSDNGHHDEGGHDTDRFDPNGPLRGMKRDLYEGGIRVPLIARWPGTIQAGGTTNHIAYFGDLMATAAELADVEKPANVDSISIAPVLRGDDAGQKSHEYLYWEFYEQGSKQAVRFGPWKAVRQPMLDGPIELFNLDVDLGEASDVAADNPELVAKATEMMKEAHTPNPNWKRRGNARKSKNQPKPGDGRPRF